MRALIVIALLVSGCGGGGVGYTPAPGELLPWEWAEGICSFDDDAAKERAYADGADCMAILIGNTANGLAWPPASWPSTAVVWRAK